MQDAQQRNMIMMDEQQYPNQGAAPDEFLPQMVVGIEPYEKSQIMAAHQM
jgi:hypothetical protein